MTWSSEGAKKQMPSRYKFELGAKKFSDGHEEKGVTMNRF